MCVLSFLPVATLRSWHEILKFLSASLNLKMSKIVKHFYSSNTLLNWQYVLNWLDLLIYYTLKKDLFQSVIYIWIFPYVAFCTIMAISRQKEARSRDYALLLFQNVMIFNCCSWSTMTHVNTNAQLWPLIAVHDQQWHKLSCEGSHTLAVGWWQQLSCEVRSHVEALDCCELAMNWI